MSPDGFSLFDLAPGKVISDRFRLIRSNRNNELVSTFEAENTKTGRHHELVLFPAHLFEESLQVEEFCLAWKPWAKIVSPHVLNATEVLRQPGDHVFLVTEFPAAGSLRDRLKRSPRMAPELVKAVGLQLLEGVVAIHEAGLVHGDIKPSTICLREDAQQPFAQLVDGGITPALWNAKHLGERTALIGTPFYASVEQFGGDSPDTLSDIYNVATVLFELTTGVIPWPGKNFLQVFQAKLDKAAPSMRARAPEVEVSAAFEKAIVTGLMAARSERYQSARDFREALAAVP